MRALEPTEIAVFGADAIIGPDNVPISQSELKLKGNPNPNHEAALARANAKAAIEIPSDAVMKQLLSLVKDSADDKATAARVEKLQAATKIARDADAANEKSSRELDAKRLAHLKVMADERAKHERMLEAEGAKFEADRAAKLSDVTEREQAVAKREAELCAASAKLSEQLADVDKRLNLIRQAAR